MKIGFIGIGSMGRFMARHLADSDHTLTVFDLNKETASEVLSRGASWGASPQAVAAASEIVFTSLPMPKDVESVSTGPDGILSGAAPGSIICDVSTTDPDTIRRIGSAAQSKGVHVLDAPVSGGAIGAERATLCMMVGGEESVFSRAKPVLDLMGKTVVHCGALGSGAVCKIVNNLINLGSYFLVAEALILGVKAGVATQTLFDVVSNSSGNTQSMQEFPGGLFDGKLDEGFQLDLAAKDIRLATEVGRRLGVPLDSSERIEQHYAEAQKRGWGKMSAVSVVRLQEERAKVEIRV